MDTITMKDLMKDDNGDTSTDITTAVTNRQDGSFSFTRIESNWPITLRKVRYPDGREVVQGGYQWTDAMEGGIAWRDLPIIDVDINGQEKE